MSENYNQRQYALMLERLKAYENHQLEIGSLIGDLEGLLNALANVPDHWKQAFRSYWADLEIARALALDNGSQTLDEQSKKIVNDSIGHLKFLVLNEIDDPADKKCE